MNNNEIVAKVGNSDIAEEDPLRAQMYGLLASLFSKGPNEAELSRLAQLHGDESP